MRIVLLAHSRAPWTPHYARTFLALGHTVTVLSFTRDPIDGVDLRFVGSADAGREAGKGQFLTRAPHVRRLLRSLAPDVVLATYVISDGLTAALSWSGPLVVSARGGDVLAQAGNPPLPEAIRKWVTRFICGRARRIHTVSDELTDQLVAWGIARDRIVCFPMGVDVDRFRPPRDGEPGAEPATVICTRRHDAVYDNHVLVTALARLKDRRPDLRATFVGGGPLLEARRAQAAREGLDGRVTFVPQVDHGRLPELLRRHGLYVSASSSDGTSSSLLEAMACGLVPVVSRIRANLAWVRDGETGFLFDVGDADDLARALERGLQDTGVRARARTENPSLVAAQGNQQVNNRRMLTLLEEAARR